MAEPRTDRLSRDEALLLQQRALREWRESHWLAEHNPEAWEEVSQQDDGEVCVDLGGGIGDADQEPGCIVIGFPGTYTSPADLYRATGERRIPDMTWDFGNGLPFADQVVDCYYLTRNVGRVLASTRDLADELRGTLRVAGEVVLSPQAAQAIGASLLASGFSKEGDRYVLTSQNRPLEEIAPPLVAETIMGQPVIREPRRPS